MSRAASNSTRRRCSVDARDGRPGAVCGVGLGVTACVRPAGARMRRMTQHADSLRLGQGRAAAWLRSCRESSGEGQPHPATLQARCFRLASSRSSHVSVMAQCRMPFGGRRRERSVLQSSDAVDDPAQGAALAGPCVAPAVRASAWGGHKWSSPHQAGPREIRDRWERRCLRRSRPLPERPSRLLRRP